MSLTPLGQVADVLRLVAHESTDSQQDRINMTTGTGIRSKSPFLKDLRFTGPQLFEDYDEASQEVVEGVADKIGTGYAPAIGNTIRSRTGTKKYRDSCGERRINT